MSDAPIFFHLRTHTEFSIVDGTLRIDEMVGAARADGQGALAITDLANLFGLVKFYQAARSAGVKPIAGCDVWVTNPAERDKPHRLLLLIQDRSGYLRVCDWLSRAWINNTHRGRAELHPDWFEEGTDGLIALSGAMAGEIGCLLAGGATLAAREAARKHARWFEGRFYLELQRAGQPGTDAYLAAVVPLAAELRLPVVATHPAQFATADDYEAHEARVCVADGEILGNSRRVRRFTPEQYLKTRSEMAELFADLPSALANTVQIAQRCNLVLELGKPQLPNFPTPDGETIDDYLRQQAGAGLEKRLELLYPDIAAREAAAPRYRERLAFECDTIVKMGFPGYFLIVADFINWAGSTSDESFPNGIPFGPGRGSGAGSLVAYSLGITGLDPLRYNLLFERFLNPERVSMPDFDIDFCQDGRDRVIDYVRRKYGSASVSQIATFGTMAAKAALRDIGRVLDMPYGLVDSVAKLVPNQPGKVVTIRRRDDAKDDKLVYAREIEPQINERERDEEDVAALLELAGRVEGITRNIGMHAGGVLIAPGKLTDFCPLYVANGVAGSDQGVISQYDKDDVEAVGLVKFDFLGLTTLTILDWAVRYIRARGGEHANFDLTTIALDDAATYDKFKTANAVAVFQFESRGMQDMLVKAQPDKFEDIVALNALYRPGPMDLIPSFCDRKHGKERVEYPDPRVEAVLSETYGIMVYQEQVMQMAQIVGGYSLGGADLLRRAMGKKKADEMATHRELFAKGAEGNGIGKRKADEIFDLMEKFAGYGFNKSHAVAYALLAYQTAWLKTHYPAEFYAANMSCAMDDSEKIRILWDDATRRNHVAVLPPDINASGWRFEPVIGADGKPAVRYGLGGIKGTGQAAVASAIAARQSGGPFKSLFDFAARVDRRTVHKRVLEALVCAGAFDSIDTDRARLFASCSLATDYAEQAEANANQDSLFGDEGAAAEEPALVAAPAWSEQQQLIEEKAVFGFSLSGHLFSSVSAEVRAIARTALSHLKPSRDPQTIAGVITNVRVVNGRRGRMAIVTIDDASAAFEVVVFGELFEARRAVLVSDAVIIVVGTARDDAFTGGLKFTADDLWTFAEARARFVRHVRVVLDVAQSPEPAALWASSGDPHQPGLRIELEIRNGSWRGILQLPEDRRIPADDALLRAAIGCARAARYELVY
ncbi:DNA polymerase III subunit alpha [soil metagenome]